MSVENKRDSYFSQIEVSLNLSDTCCVCGEDADFRLEERDPKGVIFKNFPTKLCNKCAVKVMLLMARGIDF